ncbi:MAG TPA: hypothetical protein VEK79_03540 [Thermoanaerobaculia bacterium]|nr:hypothetical protein [Thermoanaerobaculia bacterium]
MRRTFGVLVLAAASVALPVRAVDALQWSGFALARATNDDALGAQIQLGVDWRPLLGLGAHVHLLARDESDGSKRGRIGIVQAYLEQNFERGAHRVRLTEGAFFLPGSRENVDALWESPYTITPSALNSWIGEEFRPVGVDAAYTLRRQWTSGITLFTGNDTLGALPAVRGWAMRDHWALLGEHLPVDEEYFTSVSAETDNNLGFAVRGRWNNDRATVQLTHIDNRSDALEHGDLVNWDTRFDILGADYSAGDWTIAAEYGWGVTDVIDEESGQRFSSDIDASYVLVSRALARGRVSLRGDIFNVDDDEGHALTAAYFWSPRGPIRAGVEAIFTGDDRRLALEVRYAFSP